MAHRETTLVGFQNLALVLPHPRDCHGQVVQNPVRCKGGAFIWYSVPSMHNASNRKGGSRGRCAHIDAILLLDLLFECLRLRLREVLDSAKHLALLINPNADLHVFKIQLGAAERLNMDFSAEMLVTDK